MASRQGRRWHPNASAFMWPVVLFAMFSAAPGTGSPLGTVASGMLLCAGTQPLSYVAPARTGPISLLLRRDGTRLLLLDGGIEVASRELACTSDASIGGPDREDTLLTVDYSSGPIPIPIDYHPGVLGPSTDNLLSIQGGTFNDEHHRITGAHSGIITLDGAPIVYSNLTPINDTTPAINYLFNDVAVSAAPVNITTGAIVSGFQTIQIDAGVSGAFETTSIANKINVTFANPNNNALSYTVNIPTASTGLASLKLLGGTNDGLVVNLQATPASVPTDFVGSALTTINVGDSGGSAQGIQADVTIENPPSLNSIVVNDSADVTSRTVTLSSVVAGSGRIHGLAPADINIVNTDTASLTINGGSGGNTINVNTSEATFAFYPITLKSGFGDDIVNLLAVSGHLSVHGQAGLDTVVIGSLAPASSGGTLAGITAQVDLDNAFGFDDLTIDDSGDSTGRIAAMTGAQITGLAVGAITYAGTTDLSALKVNGGTGSDTFTVTPWASSSPFPVSIKGGLPTTLPGDRLNIDLSGGATGTALSATLGASGYSGSYTFTNRNAISFSEFETLSPANQTINFTSTAPADAHAGGAGSYVPTATATSGLPVVFSIDPSAASVCAILAGGAVQFNGVGTCVVNADQPGNAAFLPAPQVSQQFAVGPHVPIPTLSKWALFVLSSLMGLLCLIVMSCRRGGSH